MSSLGRRFLAIKLYRRNAGFKPKRNGGKYPKCGNYTIAPKRLDPLTSSHPALPQLALHHDSSLGEQLAAKARSAAASLLSSHSLQVSLLIFLFSFSPD